MRELPSIEEKAVELIEKFEALATDIAPDAIELGMATARVAAGAALAKQLFIIALFSVCVAFVVKSLRFLARWAEENEVTDSNRNENELPIPIGTLVVSGGVAFLCSLPGILGGWFFDIWPIAGVIRPELWIAKQVLGW